MLERVPMGTNLHQTNPPILLLATRFHAPRLPVVRVPPAIHDVGTAHRSL